MSKSDQSIPPMRTREGIPPQKSFCDLYDSIKEQERLLAELEGMSQEIGNAKAIREISSDYRKKILASLMEPFLKDESVAAAEIKARSTRLYSDDISSHHRDLAKAETALARREWLLAKIDALRTVISTERSLFEMK